MVAVLKMTDVEIQDSIEKESASRIIRLFKYLGRTKALRRSRGYWDSHPVGLIGFLLLGLVVLFFILSFVPGKLFEDFSASLATEMLSIAITVLLIDALNNRQRNKELKAQLIRQMGSSYPGVAVTAANELQYHGWGFGEDTSLVGAYLLDANLERAILWFANLEGAQLLSANLQGAGLAAANLKGAFLLQANLKGAHLESANLERASLQLANLRGASLVEANLREANLQGAILERADLNGANLEGAVNITPQQLKEAFSLFGTVMPDRSSPEEWALKLFEKDKIDGETFTALIGLAKTGGEEE